MKSYKYAGYEYLPSEYSAQRCTVIFGRLANRALIKAVAMFLAFELGVLSVTITYPVVKGVPLGTFFNPALISGMIFFLMAITYMVRLAFLHGNDEARRAHDTYSQFTPEMREELKGSEYGKHIPTRIDRRPA